MEGMCGLKCASQVLTAQEREVFPDWEDLGLCMKMVRSTHLHAASRDSEGAILEYLQFVDCRRGGVREPGGTSIGEQGTDKGFVCGY